MYMYMPKYMCFCAYGNQTRLHVMPLACSVLAGLLDRALQHLAADAWTAGTASSIRLGMFHAQAIARELTAVLEGSNSALIWDIKDCLKDS